MSKPWEPWARCYLKVAVEGLSLPALESVLGPSSTPASAESWVVDLEQSSDEPLESQILRVGTYLESLTPKLETLGSAADVSLAISWTPRPGQDGFALSPQLLTALARIRASVLIDTYTDD
jgi:hypothetical protein